MLYLFAYFIYHIYCFIKVGFRKMSKKIILRDQEHIVQCNYISPLLEIAPCLMDKKNEGHLLQGFEYCRESLAEYFWQEGIDRAHKVSIATSLIICDDSPKHINTRTKYTNLLKKSLKLINIIENKHKWTLTKMYECDHYNNEYTLSKDRIVHLFIGPSKWIRSPQMLSLFLLLIRVPISTPSFSKDIRTYRSILDKLNNTKFATGDIHYLRISAKYWPILFDKFNELFRNFSTKRNWDASKMNDEYDYVYEGIYSLCTLESYDKKLQSKFVKLAKEHGIK